MNWRPLSLRDQPDVRFDAPSEGLPVWLRDPVTRWTAESFLEVKGGKRIRGSALQHLALALRLERPLEGPSDQARLVNLQTRMLSNEEFGLDVLDWMIHHPGHFTYGKREANTWAASLGTILRQGGSAWEVRANEGAFELTRRAVGPVAEVLNHTATKATRAHHHLATAWSKLAGRDPDPSGAYREAVRAVEAVAKPVILPANDRATLGQIIAAMKAKPEKWTVTIGAVDDVRVQMEAVWKGQLDRHGTNDETVPLNVSPEEADAAFSTCLNLTRWFAGDHIVRAE